MSSPGKASWCICVRMSPGSTRSTRRSGRSAPRTAASCSKPALAARVGAPALVGLDGRVGGDGDDGGAGAQVGEERLHDPELGDEVRLERRAEVVEPEVGERRERRRAERAGVEHDEVEPAEGPGGGGEVGAVGARR